MPPLPSRYRPLPQVPEPVGCRGGWGFHSQGCSVHSSQRLPWGLPQSEAAGCHPGRIKEGMENQQVSRIYVNKFHALWSHGLESVLSPLQIPVSEEFFFHPQCCAT